MMIRKSTSLLVAIAALAVLPLCTAASSAAAPASMCAVREDERSITVQEQIPVSQSGNFFTAVRSFAQEHGYRYTDSGGANLQNAKNYWIPSADTEAYKDKLFLHVDNESSSDRYNLTGGWREGNADWKLHWDRFLKFVTDMRVK